MGAEHFPLYIPHQARRAFATDPFCRRMSHIGRWSRASRLLEIGGSLVSLELAGELGCSVTAIDPDPGHVEALEKQAQAQGLSDQVEVRRVGPGALPFSEGEFDGVLLVGTVPLPLEEAVRGLRRFLAPRGRLVLTYPARVGRNLAKSIGEHWERKLGEPLRLPRELLQAVEQAGFEPDTAETLDDAGLSAHYREVEPLLDGEAGRDGEVAAMRKEIELFRATGKASATYALIIARRKEPGEKPPPSRDAG